MCKKAGGRRQVELVEARIREEETYDPVFNPTKPKPYYKTFCFTFTLIVFIASSTGTIIMWGTDTWNISILKVLTFEDGGLVYTFWKKPDIETIIKIYPFNYTNIKNIHNETPRVEEIGPYVFRERIEKVNVIFHDNGTLTYSDNRTHHFDEVASKGSLLDYIYTPNVPFISAAAAGADRSIITQLGLAALLKGLDTRPFLPIDIEGFARGFDDSFSIFARKISSVLDGTEPPKFGLLSSRTGLSRDRLTIGSGVPDLEKVGVVTALNGDPTLKYFSGDDCNSLSGSDGTIFPGNVVKRSSKLHIFVSSFCRRIPIEFYGERVHSQSFPAKRYELPHNVFDKPSDNSEDSCFCTGKCTAGGTFLTSTCNYGAPMLISFPHFLHGDPQLLENVTGLDPDETKHRFYLDIHETLGVPIGGNSRFQLNVLVRHCPFLKQLDVIPNETVLPIAWIDVEFGEIKGKLKELIHHATYTAAYLDSFISWSSLLLLLISSGQLFYYVYYKR